MCALMTQQSYAVGMRNAILRNYRKLMPEYVSMGFIGSSSPDFRSEKRKQDDRGGIAMWSVCLGFSPIFLQGCLWCNSTRQNAQGRKKPQP